MQPPTTIALSDWLAYVERWAADKKCRTEFADAEGLDRTGCIMSGAWFALDELAKQMRAALQSEPLEPTAGMTGTADVRRLTEERDRAERICLLQDELIDAYSNGWGMEPYGYGFKQADRELDLVRAKLTKADRAAINAMRADRALVNAMRTHHEPEQD